MNDSEVSEPDQPREYSDGDVIPFVPDGDSPLIDGCVELVRGTAGHFQGGLYARKTIILRGYSNERSAKHQLTREARALHSARHTHVIQLAHTYFDNRSNNIRFSIIMDRAEASLTDFLEPGHPNAKLPHLDWFGCLLGAVRHIHTFGIRHRDIKPSNILIKKNTVLLADFGISLMGLGKTMPTTNLKRNAGRAPDYCAPEVELGRTRGRSADIFSLGAVFLEICLVHLGPEELQGLRNTLQTEQHSSYAKTIDHVHEWIRRLELRIVSKTWQREVLRICKRMLHSDRDVRPTAEALHLPSQLPTCTCTQGIRASKNYSLTEACQQGSVQLVLQLLREGASPRAMGAIHLAAEQGAEGIVDILLKEGADVDSLNQADQTPLHCASRSGRHDVVRLLLQNHASVNKSDENGHTALHGAAAHGYGSIVEMLLHAGADSEVRGNDRKRPYSLAKKGKHNEVMQIIDAWVGTNRMVLK